MTNQLTLPCINPATGVQFDEVIVTAPEEVCQARQTMGEAFQIWRQTPLSKRISILRKFQQHLIDRVDEITAVINQDCGKSRQDALIEVFVTADLLHQYCKHAPRWLAQQRVSGGLAAAFKRCYIEHQPYGVVGVISPWNYPFTLAMGPTLTALLAGNTVLLKPSEVTAATGKLMADLFAGVPELTSFVQVLHGDGQVGAALVESAPDFIFLTGSGPTAKKVMQAATENLTPIACELGGKDPMIVLDDADIQQTAKWGVWGAFFNSGQTCMAVERAYAVTPIYDEFVAATVAETKALRVGYSPSQLNQNHLSTITMPRQMEIIEDHLQDALAKGAKIVTGGRRNGLFFEPTVLIDVDHSMKIMRDETFGPILPIMKVKNEVEAVRLANDSVYGLGGSVWGEDIARAEQVAHQLETASVLVNDSIVHFGIPLLPFGGVKQSGDGRTHGKEGLLKFTQSHAYAIGKTPAAFDIATILRRPGNYQKTTLLMRLLFGTSLRAKVKPIAEALPPAPSRRLAIVGLFGGLMGLIAALLWRSRR